MVYTNRILLFGNSVGRNNNMMFVYVIFLFMPITHFDPEVASMIRHLRSNFPVV